MAGATIRLCGTKVLYYRRDGYFKFIGRPDNVQASALMYNFICHQVEALYKLALPKGLTQKERAAFRKAFKVGAAVAARDKAQQIMDSNQPPAGTSTELVCLHRQTLNAEIDEFLSSVKLAKPRTRSVSVNPEAYGKGVIAGKSIRLNEGVKQ